MRVCYVGVGSNIRPRRHVRLAVRLLIDHPGIRVTDSSTFYRTKPVGSWGGPDFLNGVLEIETDLEPDEIRQTLALIETAAGRQRTVDQNASRTLDLDLLLCRPERLGPEASAEVDHPDVVSRPFVAVPLLELAPALRLSGAARDLRDVAESFAPGWGRPKTRFSRRLRRLLTATRRGTCELDARPDCD